VEGEFIDKFENGRLVLRALIEHEDEVERHQQGALCRFFPLAKRFSFPIRFGHGIRFHEVSIIIQLAFLRMLKCI
jgi:hypothetical protein